MNKMLRNTAIVGILALGLGACNPFLGQRVEVPPASKGMILGANGFQGDIIPPSRFRLSRCVTFSFYKSHHASA